MDEGGKGGDDGGTNHSDCDVGGGTRVGSNGLAGVNTHGLDIGESRSVQDVVDVLSAKYRAALEEVETLKIQRCLLTLTLTLALTLTLILILTLTVPHICATLTLTLASNLTLTPT
jgi:hypothetical protein